MSIPNERPIIPSFLNNKYWWYKSVKCKTALWSYYVRCIKKINPNTVQKNLFVPFRLFQLWRLQNTDPRVGVRKYQEEQIWNWQVLETIFPVGNGSYVGKIIKEKEGLRGNSKFNIKDERGKSVFIDGFNTLQKLVQKINASPYSSSSFKVHLNFWDRVGNQYKFF